MDQVARLPATLALVDADAALRHALAFAFETAGFSVISFADAETALADDCLAWRSLVLDHRLPGMSGLDLLHKVRTRGLLAPAFLITTNPTRQILSRARSLGAEVFEKPLLDDRLLRRAREVLLA